MARFNAIQRVGKFLFAGGGGYFMFQISPVSHDGLRTYVSEQESNQRADVLMMIR